MMATHLEIAATANVVLLGDMHTRLKELAPTRALTDGAPDAGGATVDFLRVDYVV